MPECCHAVPAPRNENNPSNAFDRIDAPLPERPNSPRKRDDWRGVSHLDGKLASWEDGRTKTTLDLADELIRKVKLRAVVQGRTGKDLVAEFLRQGLGREPLGRVKKRAASSMVKIGESGLPVIRCAKHAPAARMGVAKLLALEQETLMGEDLQRARRPL